MKKIEQYEGVEELSLGEIYDIDGGGIIKDTFAKIGAGVHHTWNGILDIASIASNPTTYNYTPQE